MVGDDASSTCSSVERLFHDLRVAAAQTLRAISQEGDAFSIVGAGADLLPTSRIDRELEKTCIQVLESSGLVGSLLSEEVGRVALAPAGKFDAILDPLDGTSNAEMGYPYYALSLALVEGNSVTAGMVYNYCSGDVFTSFKDRGAYRNGRPIRVNSQPSPKQGRIVTSRPLSSTEAVGYSRLMLETKRLRMAGSPALDIAHVAAGTFMAYVDYHLPSGLIHTHDVAAARLILMEAGGVLLDERGRDLILPDNAHETFNVFALNERANFEKIYQFFS